MEIKEVKRELNDYIRNKRYIARKQEEIEILTEQIKKVTASYSDMPRGGNSSKEDLMVKKLDLENEVFKYLAALMELQATIEKTVQKLEPRQRNVITLMYLNGMRLWEVAEEERYSCKQCGRILKEAYRQYAEIRGKENGETNKGKIEENK